jgi:hypothetical protein
MWKEQSEHYDDQDDNLSNLGMASDLGLHTERAASILKLYSHAHGLWCCTPEDALYKLTHKIIDWEPCPHVEEPGAELGASAMAIEHLAITAMRALHGSPPPGAHPQDQDLGEPPTVDMKLEPQAVANILASILSTRGVVKMDDVLALEGGKHSWTARVAQARTTLDATEKRVRECDWVTEMSHLVSEPPQRGRVRMPWLRQRPSCCRSGEGRLRRAS